MKLIELTQGKFAQVDDEDYEYLNQWKWYAKKQNGIWYAARTLKTLRMHRIIMRTNDKQIIDHKDRNGLNNQKSNLRFCTFLENSRNRKSKINSTSNFLGVCKDNSTGKCKNLDGTYYRKDYGLRWLACIKVNNKKLNLGRFPYTKEGEVLAAKTYDEAAKKYFNEFANLNFK